MSTVLYEMECPIVTAGTKATVTRLLSGNRRQEMIYTDPDQ